MPEETRSAAEARGREAEARVAARLEAEGWRVLARRQRAGRGGPAGEIDLIAEREGLLAFIEVKRRARLSEAALTLAPAQQARLLAGAEAWLAAHPGHGAAGVRFDLVLVDAAGRMRRIADAFRLE
ncbi:YraN family protein [Roseomonas sp. KE0001]|uniref:YraN family protein n=1 Tax=Roseomonas sp. KE0001 TaxID=2479201 RepID=UPI0018DF8F18|nr:YraN family protein [Roseomonas sp. KE0001]MBI0432221.1 YraN family protein [Roseomonas sp. KE0001]